MRYLITTIALVFSLNILAQAEAENFYLVEGEMSWQKAYSTDKSKEAVYEYFENSKLFSVIELNGNQLVGRLKKQATDPNKTGVAGVPPIVNKTDFKGDITIEFRVKEKDYVISFTHIVFVGRGDLIKKNQVQKFEDQFVSKSSGKYRPGFLKSPKRVYNTTFTKLFELN